MRQTWANLVRLWSGWQVQLMVLLSLFLQLFLFFTGGLRRRRLSKLIMVFVWLAYVGADLVAVYALGLLSRYDYKSKRGNGSFRETDSLIFIWVPFLLVHLGGQDTITAFSIEDNNLWLRHLLNLVVQVSLALYAFWNSLDQNSLQLVATGIFLFVAGIIKYAERTWALKCGSLEGLQSSAKGYKDKEHEGQKDNKYGSYSDRIVYARQMVLYARGLFAGLTVSRLERKVRESLTQGLAGCDYILKMKIVLLELDMMYDTLYTKAVVLQTWTGCILRAIAHISTAVAFAFFVATSKHGHSMAAVVITYALFAGALLTEACAIGAVMLSPLTLPHLGMQLCLSLPIRKTMRAKERSVVPICVGQFSLATSAFRDRSTPRLMLKAMNAFGLDKFYRDLWHVKQVEGHELVGHFVDWFNTTSNGGVSLSDIRTDLGVSLNLLDILSQRFEVGIIFLHLLTDVCKSLNLVFDDYGEITNLETVALAQECERLSNYMMYLLVVRPSMLPVSSDYAAMGLFDYKRRADIRSRTDIPEMLMELGSIRLELLGCTLDELRMQIHEIGDSVQLATYLLRSGFRSPNLLPMLREIKEMWIRLLVYAASKSRGELHARQLGNGGELLTFIWLLLAHHGLGNAAEVGLNSDDDFFYI